MLHREVMRPTSDRGRLAALATICSLAGVALGFALAGTMFASIPITARVTYPAHVRCAAETPAWIGVGIRSDGPVHGAWIRTVRPSSPAAGIDLRVGDVITGLDGRAIATDDQLVSAVRSRRPGTHVTMTVQRGDLRFERGLVLEPMPHAVWRAELAQRRTR
jgi:putative serine protease PepD